MANTPQARKRIRRNERRAVVNGNVIPMDDDVASRWGPRIVDYIEQVGAAVEHTAAAPAG